MRAFLLLILTVAAVLSASEDAPLPFPDMAPTVGRYIDKLYYDHARVRPRAMVAEALEALENADERIATTWSDGVVVLDYGARHERVPAPMPGDLQGAMTVIERVRMALDQELFDVSRRRELSYRMLNGALSTLDPHSVIYPPRPASDFEEEIKGEFFGIGAWLNQRDGLIRIDRVMPGLPADRAGIEDGDIILRVNGERTIGLSLPQAVSRIKGPRGTPVVLTVEREDGALRKDITVIRDRIKVPVLRYFRRDGIGYVRMDEFNRQTANELRMAVLRLLVQEQAPLRGFVLDLRFNSGGLLSQAQDTSDFFLPHSKEIVRTVALGAEPHIVLSSRDVLLKVPMMILVGPGSASAAEILAGSLQRNDRAVVVGRTTFGKGSVQTIRRLKDNSQLKITIQEYQLAGGVSLQERGVLPDLELLRHSLDTEGGVDLVPYSLQREADNEFALRGHEGWEHRVTYRLPWLETHRTREEMRRHNLSSRDFTPDQEASLAIDLLAETVDGEQADAVAEAGVQAFTAGRSRQFTLDRLREPVAARAEMEAEHLSQALAAREDPVIWGPPVADDRLDALDLSLDYHGPAQLVAGETATMTFSVTNPGSIDVGRLYGVIHADEASPFWEEEVVFGLTPSGGTAEGVVHFAVPPRIYPGREHFTLALYHDELIDPLAKVPVEVELVAKPRPHFSYRWELVEADANRDGIIDLDEPVTIRIHLRNDGRTATGEGVTLYVYKNDDYFTQLGEGRFKLESMAPGAESVCDVPLTVRSKITVGDSERRFDSESFTLQIRAEETFADEIDGRYRASLFHAPEFPVASPVAGADIRQPWLQIEDVAVDEGRGMATVTVGIDDDNLRYVSLFHDNDKLELVPETEISDGRYRTELPLHPGVNAIRVMATDADEVSDLVYLRLWGSEEAVADSAPGGGAAELPPAAIVP